MRRHLTGFGAICCVARRIFFQQCKADCAAMPGLLLPAAFSTVILICLEIIAVVLRGSEQSTHTVLDVQLWVQPAGRGMLSLFFGLLCPM